MVDAANLIKIPRTIQFEKFIKILISLKDLEVVLNANGHRMIIWHNLRLIGSKTCDIFH